MDGDLCAYCGKDESVGPMNDEHFVPRCFWVKRGRPRGMKTVPTHVACNGDVSGDDDYFRDVLAFEEGAKNHPQVQALHQGPIKNKLLHTRGTINKNLKNVGWYPVVTPSGLCISYAPGFELDWSRVERFLQKVMKGVYYTVKKTPMPQDWLFRVPRPEPSVFDDNAKLIDRMEPWQSFGDDVFCCRYCFHSEGAMGCIMAFYRFKIFIGNAVSPRFEQTIFDRLALK